MRPVTKEKKEHSKTFNSTGTCGIMLAVTCNIAVPFHRKKRHEEKQLGSNQIESMYQVKKKQM